MELRHCKKFRRDSEKLLSSTIDPYSITSQKFFTKEKGEFISTKVNRDRVTTPTPNLKFPTKPVASKTRTASPHTTKGLVDGAAIEHEGGARVKVLLFVLWGGRCYILIRVTLLLEIINNVKVMQI